jgi:DeoR/GlpR family transcriptional regulator of sugar metabolism
VLSEERRNRILQFIEQNGSATVGDLSRLMGVSLMTIRRDIAFLAEQGLAIKTYGGAVSLRESTSTEPRYEVKSKVNIAEKKRIGYEAAKLVNDGETIILDSGSTTFYIASYLQAKRDLTVVTNDLVIAFELSKNSSISLIMAGGIVRPTIFSTYGTYTEEMLHQLMVDKVFLAADAVHTERGILNSNPEEVSIKRRMLNAGREVYLVVDHTKFSKLGLSFVCDFKQINTIISDSGLPENVAASLRERGLELRLC